MGFFDIFKKKNELEKAIDNSIDEYFQKSEEFEKLKKGELTSVDDTDLRTAVMSWMWGKFEEDWTDQYEVIESLPKPCRDVYACCTVVDEINNGGLNQLFFNSTGQFAKMAQEGFSSMGNEKLSYILKTAIVIFKKNVKLLEKYNDGTLESFSESYNEELFDELDNGFFEEESEFDGILVTYIRNNESAFGD